jgi:hypothetical protein
VEDTQRRWPATVGHLTLNVWIEIEIVASMTDWQGKFNDDYLLNQLDLAKVDNSKVVELHECYNFANWSLALFDMVCKLHGIEVGYFETVTSNFRLRNFLSVGQPLKLTCGPFFSMF